MNQIRSRAIAFAWNAAFAIVLTSTLAAANGIDSDQDGVSDELEDATERTIFGGRVTGNGDAFEVSSYLANGHLDDKFEFWYSEGRFGVYYEVMEGASTSYELELSSLVEWKDQDPQNGRIDEAEILRRTPLGSEAFGGMSVTRTEWRDSDDGRVLNFVMDSRDGQVSLNVTVAQRFTRLTDLTLTPMEARMEVRVTPALSDPSASVGLELRLSTEPGDSVSFEDHSWDEIKQFAPGEHAVNVTGTEGGRSASAFFSWTDDATISDQPAAVGFTSNVAGSDAHNLSYAYPRASPTRADVFHQMAFGVRSAAYDLFRSPTPATPPLQGDIFLFTGTFVGVAGLVGATAFLSNRRRVRREDDGREP